jgi:hypothetical protein
MNKRSRLILTVAIPVAVLITSLGAYVALGPYLTVKALGESLAARDSAGVAECVDFPKLRDSIKAQVDSGVSLRSKALFAEDPIASLAAGLASSLSGPLVDSLVTPTGLEALLSGEQLLSSLGTKAPGATERVQAAISNARYSYKSPSEFTVELEPAAGTRVTLLLAREGLCWKVAGIELAQ